MCIGGPALIYYVTPTEEELFKARYTIRKPLRFVLMVYSGIIRNYRGDL